ncbi:MAG: glycerol-3-phosphate 1-O-acyltransferase PlsY [Phycisphaeraceae bacterium]|jgi:glycerol-3-phosphate acyltransferase PlsY|nr:glycerol-3-phosphate 1-O-acyltransferase PlsY [Phycisphaeraceae bacterium]MDP7347519.1 glycerol-3-phosphate 1-O-acyltransferase PlsY [Phycisphaeraceae bacterium]
MWQQWWFWAIVGYVAGSVPFGWLIGRARGVDLRKFGSGNIGATNAGRVLGRKWGLISFALDLLKGAVPVVSAGCVLGFINQWSLPAAQAWAWLAIATCPVVGHVFPVWLGFRGGKGVATTGGVLLGLWPAMTFPALGAGIIWLITVGLSRYVGLASVIAAIAMPLLLMMAVTLRADEGAMVAPFAIVATLLAALVVFRHRTNLARLRKGTEPRIGDPVQ